MKILLIFIAFVALSYGREGFGPGEQDWGYVTVRPEAHMFWWLYETTANVTNITERPLLVWLQGGPGESSTGVGNFIELGPLDVDLNLRDQTWVTEANALFIDNPVGAGFSYVDDISALTKTTEQITEDLINCLLGFYDKHPEFQNTPLYFGGQSYGAKMSAAFATELNKNIKTKTIRSNLKGISLIAPWIAPSESTLNWPSYLYNTGAIDKYGYDAVVNGVKRIQSAIHSRQFEIARDEFFDTTDIIKNVGKDVDIYNIMTKVLSSILYKSKNLENDDNPPEPTDMEKLEKLMNGPVKEKLGLNVTWAAQRALTNEAQKEHFMRSGTHTVEQILNETTIKVQVVTGQLDLLSNTPGTVQWTDELQWSGSKLWKKVPRNAFSVNGINEGYQKILGRFSLIWMNRAGHMTGADNPVAMKGILKDLISDGTLQ